MISLRLAPLAACALLLGACTPPAAGPSPRPDESALLLARVHSDTAAGADSLSAWLLRACRGNVDVRRGCVERALYGVLERSGVARAMATLDRLAEQEPDVRREAHGLAHALGIAAYRNPETVAATFASCPNTQISGCYHGVIQGYFLDVARRNGTVTGADLDALCEPHRQNPPLYGQCTHGIGHGLMALLNHQVPPALERCDQLKLEFSRESCYGGVFMENIVAVTHPEHTAESHAAISHETAGGGHEGMDHGSMAGMDHGAMDHGAMAGMDHGAHGAAPAGTWKPLDRDDPLYPCTAVADKYHYQCYLIQTSAILPTVNGDPARTAQICSTAPGRMAEVCYASLGRDLTAYAGRDPRATAELCARSGPVALVPCIRGAAVSLVDVSANPADGFALCRVAPAAAKQGCYGDVAVTMHGHLPDPARREAMCATVEADFVEQCRASAGLPRPAR